MRFVLALILCTAFLSSNSMADCYIPGIKEPLGEGKNACWNGQQHACRNGALKSTGRQCGNAAQPAPHSMPLEILIEQATYWSEKCPTPDRRCDWTDSMAYRCKDRTACSIFVDDYTDYCRSQPGGDPCGGTEKKLEVSWRCTKNGSVRRITVPQRNYAHLSCP